MSVTYGCHSCLSLMFVIYVCHSCLSLMSVIYVCHLCLSLMPVTYACHLCLFADAFCDPLGDWNIWGTLYPMTASLAYRDAIVISTKVSYYLLSILTEPAKICIWSQVHGAFFALGTRLLIVQLVASCFRWTVLVSSMTLLQVQTMMCLELLLCLV